MAIALMAVFGVILAYLLVKFGPRSMKDDKDGEGMHKRRIGEGIKRLNENKAKYATMTEDMLAQTPDDDLLEAVLSNLWAKMRPDMADALGVIQAQGEGRQRMFALYAITGGIKQAGFDKIKESPDKVLLPMAIGGLEALDMPRSVAQMRRALEAEEADDFNVPYTDAFDEEDGKARMTAYIRQHPEEFID